MSHTNPDKPSLSLLHKICYSFEYNSTSAATTYGCTHEKEAIEACKSRLLGHSGFIVKSCGFIVDLEAPFLGASSDGLVECSCCGQGVLEVKCPFRAKDADSLEQVAAQQKDFCLQLLPSKVLKLLENISIICNANSKFIPLDVHIVTLLFGTQLVFI